MIKLFRNLRQKLIEENKVGNYLKYAIGEILLVVIGILIALQINTWNQLRLDKKDEHKYLAEIKNEIEENLNVSKRNIINRLPEKIEGLMLAKDFCENRFTVKDTLGFLNMVSSGGIISDGFNILSRNIFDELTSTGNFQLITNDSIKRAVKNYYWRLETVKDIVSDKKTEYRIYFAQIRPFNHANPNYISSYDKKELMTALSNDEYRKLVDSELTYAYAVQFQIVEINKRAQELLKFINTELKPN